MKKFRFLVALTTRDNDYQQEQEAAARETARRLGVDVEIIDANNDPINQSQQLLQFVQSAAGRPDAIITEPVGGTALPTVARAAVDAGIGWVVLNREIDYDIAAIRRIRNVPVFRITSNHEEIGRIQGRQYTALLPKGGSVLYVEGPSNSSAARQRTARTGSQTRSGARAPLGSSLGPRLFPDLPQFYPRCAGAHPECAARTSRRAESR